MGLFTRFGGRESEPARWTPPAPPTAQRLLESLDETEAGVAGGAVPSCVAARVHRVAATVRDAIPLLDKLGAGSYDAYAVMATASDYLPEAVSGYVRLPRRFADSRPVDGGRTSLMVLVDQLDLLGATMDQVFDAVCREDANALVAHGRFLAEKFGAPGGALDAGELRVPDMPAPDMPPPDLPARATAVPGAPDQGSETGSEPGDAAAPSGVTPLSPPETTSPAMTSPAPAPSQTTDESSS